VIIRKATFVKSASTLDGMLAEGAPEFAMCGRSNVGKSSLINMLCGAKIAKISKDPGRTRLINYFAINDEQLMLVDLPGYGFARVSKEEKARWGEMIEDYLKTGVNLCGVFLLLDIRHEPSEEDIVMINYLHSTAMPFAILATKADKLSRAQTNNAKLALAKNLRVGSADIIPVSSMTGAGKEQILERVERILSAPAMEPEDDDMDDDGSQTE